jgi:subtilisin family serine protease
MVFIKYTKYIWYLFYFKSKKKKNWGKNMFKKQIWFLLILLMILPSISSASTSLTNSFSQKIEKSSLENNLSESFYKTSSNSENDPVGMAKELNLGHKTSTESENKRYSNYLSSDEINKKIDEIYKLKENYKRNSYNFDRESINTLPYVNDKTEFFDKQSENSFGTIIVKFASLAEQSLFSDNIPKSDILFKSRLIPYISIRTTESTLSVLKFSLGVVNIYDDVFSSLPDYIVLKETEPNLDNITYYNSEAHIGASLLHEQGLTGKGIKVAVLDTGIDENHHDLQVTSQGNKKIIGQESFVDYNFDGIPDEGPEDLIGHGTHVTGTVAGNGYQIGVAPDAYILNGKVCGSIGCATTWMMEAIEWAYFMDADIITMSIGGSTVSGQDPLDSLIEAVWEKGVLFTIAAGNAGPSTSTVSSPGSNPHVLTVGATDIYDKVTSFSGRGPSVYGHPDPDIVAPGENIFSTIPNESYDIYSGTSMATPHVAGAAALLKQKFPHANPDMIKANLMKNAKDIGHSTNEQGMGLVDLQSTVENWNLDSGLLFPQFTEKDVLYLAPGETYSGYLEFLSGIRPRPTPHFAVSKENKKIITIDTSSANIFSRQNYYQYTITIPANTTPEDHITLNVVAWWMNFQNFGKSNLNFRNDDIDNTFLYPDKNPIMNKFFGKFFTKINLDIQIIVSNYQNDANSTTDAGDNFISSSYIELGNYSAFANDIDFYDVYLTQGIDYTFILEGMTGYSDFDLFVYNSSGYLTCDVCNIGFGGNSPEYLSFTADYNGLYTIRIDPWSVLYVDPYTRMNSSGSYSLSIIIGSGANSGGNQTGENGTLLDYQYANIYGVDSNNDSIYDLLAIDITINVLQTGLLDAYVWLALDKGIPLPRTTYSMAFLEMIQLNRTGIQTLTFYISGTLVADQHFAGSHIIYELFFGDPSTFTILHDLFNVYTSPSIDSKDFGPNHINYQGFEISTIDENEDDISDWLIVNVSIQVVQSFNAPYSYFTGVLWHPKGFYLWSINNPQLDISNPGQNYLIFIFSPNDFIGLVSELLNLELTVLYTFEHPLAVYSMHYGSFPYAVMINENFIVDTKEFFGSNTVFGDKIVKIEDYGLDTNQNDFYDELVFNITVQIENPGYYSLSMHPWLWSISDQKVSFSYDTSANIEWYNTGSYTLQIMTSGEIINAKQINGPFLVIFFWLDKYDFDAYYGYYRWLETSDFKQNYITQNYSFSDFENSDVTLSKIAGLNYIDQNLDNQAETVEVILEFNVSKPGSYSISMNLIDYPLGSFYSYYSYIYISFADTGLQNVSVTLSGKDFYSNKLVGFLEIWTMTIYSQSDYNMTGYSEVFFSYQNGIFWVDYNLLPGARPSGSILSMNDYGEDIDGNGLYENLVLEVQIEVYRPDNFNLYSIVYADPSTGYYTYIGFFYKSSYTNDTGILSIEIMVSAKDILTRSQEFYTNFEVWLYLIDGLGYQIDYRGPLFTCYYTLDQFEYILPSYEWFTDFYQFDTDNDSLIEAFDLYSNFHAIALTNVLVDFNVEIYYLSQNDSMLIDSFWQSIFINSPDSWYFVYFQYIAKFTGDYDIVIRLYIDGSLTESREILWLNVDTFNLPDYTLVSNITPNDWDLEGTNDTIEFSYKLHIFDNPGTFEMKFEVFMDVFIFNEISQTWQIYYSDYDYLHATFIGDRIFSSYFFWNAKETGTFKFEFQEYLYGQKISTLTEIVELSEFMQQFDFAYGWYYGFDDSNFDNFPDTILASYGVYVDPMMNNFSSLTFIMDVYEYDPVTESISFVDTQSIDYLGPIMNIYWGDFMYGVKNDGYYYFEVNVYLDSWKVGHIDLSTPFMVAGSEPDFTWYYFNSGSDTNGDSLEDTFNLSIIFNFSETANYNGDIYVDVLWLDNSTENQTFNYIETLYDNFQIQNGTPSESISNFQWQAIYEGVYLFSVNIVLNNQFYQYFYLYWYGTPV